MDWMYVALGGWALWAVFGMWLTMRGLREEPGGIYNQEDEQ